MDSLSIQLASYIIDSGSHAEFLFNDPVSRVVPSRQVNDLRSLNVDAKALIFTHGSIVDDSTALELIVCIVPDAARDLFSFSNSLVYTQEQLTRKEREFKKGEVVRYPDAYEYRLLFRHLFGFDSVQVKDPLQANSNIDDTSSELLSSILSSSADCNAIAKKSGIAFVAARTMNIVENDVHPQPVFWANGNYTKDATEENEIIFTREISIATTHIQTRYLNALFSQAEGYCKHLSV